VNIERRLRNLEEDLAPPEEQREARAKALWEAYERLCQENAIPPEEEALLLELAPGS
jgi:hypothetical protein